MIHLENGLLSAQVQELGATLRSLRMKEGGPEYIWQGDSRFWRGSAPNLFPFIGRLHGGRYTLKGKDYEMGLHGFAREKEFRCLSREKDFCLLSLEDDEHSRSIYPYRFCLSLAFRLGEEGLDIGYSLENRDEKPLFCALGAHPGFNLPLEPGLDFSDYVLSFPESFRAERVFFGPNGLCQGEKQPYPLEEGRKIRLSHELFSQEALVLKGWPGQLSVAPDKGGRGFRLSCTNMPYIGLWHAPGTQAPFLCVEPWSSLPGREGITEELSAMEDRIKLPPGEKFESRLSITLL